MVARSQPKKSAISAWVAPSWANFTTCWASISFRLEVLTAGIYDTDAVTEVPMSKLRPVIAVILLATPSLFAQGKRPLKLDDLARIREVSDPQISPDGKWIGYVVGTTDVKEDKSPTHVWVASYDGKEDRQFTFSQDSESSPRWSPDGKYLAFISGRPGAAKHDQV